MKTTVKGLEVRVGDEIGIGDLAYRIVGITIYHSFEGSNHRSVVFGETIAEHGYIVSLPDHKPLDLRLSGWEFLKRP